MTEEIDEMTDEMEEMQERINGNLSTPSTYLEWI